MASPASAPTGPNSAISDANKNQDPASSASSALNKSRLNRQSPQKSGLPYTAAAQAALASKQDKPLIGSSNLATPIAASSVPTRTAVLFLGKDWERWHRYDRDSSLQLGWQPRGVASAVTDCRSSPSISSSSSSSSSSSGSGSSSSSDSERSESDDEYVKHAAVFSSDDEEEDDHQHIGRRLSNSQSSAAGGHRSGDDVFSVQRRLTRRARLLSSTSTSTILEKTSSRSNSPAPFSPSPHIRERRYSSNGPEAAFLRHETVIGIHTPRSAHSGSPASSSGYHTPRERRQSLAPLSQILPHSTARSADDHHYKTSHTSSTSTVSFGSAGGSPKVTMTPLSTNVSPSSPSTTARGPHADRTASTQTVRADRTPAARKLSLTADPGRKRSQLSQPPSHSAETGTEQSTTRPSSHPFHAKREKRDHHHGTSRGQTNGPAKGSSSARRRPKRTILTAAARCPSVAVEGTLYDEDGPFVEGAVQDGLSVRIFNGPDVPRRRPEHFAHGTNDTSLGVNLNGTQDCSPEHDDSEQPDRGPNIVTYLITTPDNRVSSAAKLRRWAMDSHGNFYAAMEIKSVEAKLRAGGALPEPTSSAFSTSNSSGMSFESSAEAEAAYYSRELIRSMQETYVEDIISEIQKAQTLNPHRSTVSRLLRTEDGKYVRLEEDYPEEAFFVLVGCEEYELYPVVALVFVQALRALARFHNAGWLHGDVKLENLMFDVKGRLVVIDYENANVFRKPRRKRHHHHHQNGVSVTPHHSHGHQGHHQNRESRSRRKGGSRPSSRRGPESGGHAKLAVLSPSTSPGERRVELEHAVKGTAKTADFSVPTPPPSSSSERASPSPSSQSGSSVPSFVAGALQAPAHKGLGKDGGLIVETSFPAAAHECDHGNNGLSMDQGGVGRANTREPSSHADDEAEASEDDEDDEEHLVRLISYDWTPPEASLPPWSQCSQNGGGGGRMMGPSGDLWALGCNLIRAFALRDGMPDLEVREVLLGAGQRAFFKHRAAVLAEMQRGKDDATSSSVASTEARVSSSDTNAYANAQAPDSPLSPAARVLHRFHQEAPKLLQFVLARCVTPSPAERGWEAELEGLALARELEGERMRTPAPFGGLSRSFGGGSGGKGDKDNPAVQVPLRKVDAEDNEAAMSSSQRSSDFDLKPKNDTSTNAQGSGTTAEQLPLLMDVAQAAVLKAIAMSGSMWVRPKLEEARRSLGFSADESAEDEYAHLRPYGYMPPPSSAGQGDGYEAPEHADYQSGWDACDYGQP